MFVLVKMQKNDDSSSAKCMTTAVRRTLNSAQTSKSLNVRCRRKCELLYLTITRPSKLITST